MKWSPKAGKICCLGRFWVVAGRVRQVVLETRFILMEKNIGRNLKWSLQTGDLLNQVVFKAGSTVLRYDSQKRKLLIH